MPTKMKIFCMILALTSVATINAQNIYDRIEAIPKCNGTLEDVIALTDGETRHRRAVLSPNAELILLFGKDETLVMDLQSRNILKILDYYYEGQWINDSLLMFQVKSSFEVIPLYQTSEKIEDPIPEMKIVEFQIIQATSPEKQWTIADMDGKKGFVFFGFLFSNSFEKVLTHSNGGNEFVYYINGDGLIGTTDIGLSSDWSDDDSCTISFLDLDFGEHYIVESDLYIQNIVNDKVCKLTDTEEFLETWPSWSKNKVSFIDDKTHIVYVADIVLQK